MTRVSCKSVWRVVETGNITVETYGSLQCDPSGCTAVTALVTHDKKIYVVCCNLDCPYDLSLFNSLFRPMLMTRNQWLVSKGKSSFDHKPLNDSMFYTPFDHSLPTVVYGRASLHHWCSWIHLIWSCKWCVIPNLPWSTSLPRPLKKTLCCQERWWFWAQEKSLWFLRSIPPPPTLMSPYMN